MELNGKVPAQLGCQIALKGKRMKEVKRINIREIVQSSIRMGVRKGRQVVQSMRKIMKSRQVNMKVKRSMVCHIV